MSFPVAPSNGQIALVNGVSYTYASATNSWTRNIGVQGNVNASNVTAGNLTVTTSLEVSGNSEFTGNLLPSANITYDLGSATNRWRDIFLSGNTINLGGATIKADDDSGAIALIPKVTVDNPHPKGVVFSPAGTLSTVSTSSGQLTGNAIKNSADAAVQAQTTTFGNIEVTGNVTSTSGFFLGNGSQLTGLPSSYSNATVASYLPTYTGNISSGNISVTGNLSASYILGNGSQLTGLPSSYSNATVSSYLTDTSAGLVSVTSGLQLPSGTTAQRPASPAPGSMRYNSSLKRIEAYMPGAGWSEIVGDTYTIEYLSIAGGGGGGTGGSQDSGGGGGAGGVVGGTLSGVLPGITLTIIIGAGAAGFTSGGQNGNPGTATTITATGYSFTTALAGGYGVGESGNRNGGSGWGSGGGAGGWSGTKGTGTAGQGYDGGAVSLAGGGSSGGGGGAGGAGTHNGGVGTVSYNDWGQATGKGQNVGGTYYFAGGGGGAGDGRNANYGGTGGYGGGGAGGWGGAPGNGTANTGGGGGGGTGSSYGPQTSGAGGSGIVIIRYQGSQKGTGGTVTSAGGYTYHTFTGSGTYTT
jgi:hypothetical protein